MRSILENYKPLLLLLEEMLLTVESESRVKLKGILSEMQKFEFLFGRQLNDVIK
jgi:hypothetical protein